ncbi:MAG TPA: phytanoyl-CoA dioxygenase family protein [Xanthobacteraceae bacterium]|nr:phytanoyl-CoA dioxygenase family protein [Xanthobacteraceae bacterium]
MDWIVTVPPGETAGGAFSPETESAAHAAFDEHGCVLLRGAFPLATVEAMHNEFLGQFGTLDWTGMQRESEKPSPNRFLRVGGARYDITLRMTGAFGSPEVFANPALLKFLGPLLGEVIHLSNFTAVVSHPGASQQHTHRDHDHIFYNPGVGPALPTYAINVAVPLIDVDRRTGPTAVWLGSHRLAQGVTVGSETMTVAELKRGDLMLLDYRTLHAGLPNGSRQSRPIVYMVYARPWFFDHTNHITRVPLDMPIERFQALPPELHPLMIRAYSYASRARWHEVDARSSAPSRPPEAARPPATPAALAAAKPAHVGRNDPCPCGSGQKFKYCHGKLA